MPARLHVRNDGAATRQNRRSIHQPNGKSLTVLKQDIGVRVTVEVARAGDGPAGVQQAVNIAVTNERGTIQMPLGEL